MLPRVWAAITAVIGAVVVGATYFYGLELGYWADDFVGTRAEYTLPDSVPLFIVAFFGFVLIVGGILAAVIKPKTRD